MPTILDIETGPDPEGLDEAMREEPEFAAPGNYKDPLKIEAYIAEARAKWRADLVERCGLSPWTARVTCVGLWDMTMDAPEVVASGDEVECLRHAAIALGSIDQIVTFNGASFDLPFLRNRMLHAGMRVPQRLADGSLTRRYGSKEHYDTRMVLTDWDTRAPGSLTRWCRYLHLPVPEEHTGEQMMQLAMTGDYPAIERICERDVRATAALYLALTRGPSVDPAADRLSAAMEEMGL